MESVVVGVVFAAVFTLWWVKKPDWSRNHVGRDPLPRGHFARPPAVPPRALEHADSHATFRPDIEGLRSIAVLLVLVYHAKFGIVTGGLIGVDVFFVLSGFLITSLLLRELATTGTVSLSNFWARRARRLLPASGLVLLVALVASRSTIDGLSQADLARDATAAALFVANIRFWKVGTDYLAEGLKESPLLHFWSLAVEEQFYMVWPGMLLVLVRFAKVRRWMLAALIGAMWVASLALCVHLTYDTLDSKSWAFFMLPARAWELLTGAGLALAGGNLMGRLRHSAVSRHVSAVLGWVGLAGVVAVALWYTDTPAFPGYLVAIPVVGTLLVINAGSAPGSGGPAVLLRARPLQWIGARSYAIYLWHFPMLVLAARKWGENGDIVGLSVPVRIGLLVGSVVLAAISYHLVENPIRFSPHLARDATRSLVVGAWIVLAGVGAAAVLLHNPPDLSTGEAAAAPTLVAGSTTTSGTLPDSVPDTVPPGSSTSSTSSTTSTTLPPPADASHDNPPPLVPMIAANLPTLQAGEANTVVPSNLTPSLGKASDDLPEVYRTGCILNVGDHRPKNCVYGDPNSDTTIVLFGDSHAAQWMPALNAIATARGWKLVVHVKKACPDAEIPTEKDPKGTDCAVWREQVIALIGEIHPDLVIMSGYRYKQVGAAAGRDPDTVWREGMEKTVSKVRPLTDQLMLLGDSATPLDFVPNCLAGNVKRVPRCMNLRGTAVKPSRLGVEREIAQQYDADFVPTSDWLCTDTACPVIVGNVLMYRDNSHITATASVFLAPYLEAAIDWLLT